LELNENLGLISLFLKKVNNFPYLGLINSLFSFSDGDSRKLAVLFESDSWLDLSYSIFIRGD
jgi:hypothetical protein